MKEGMHEGREDMGIIEWSEERIEAKEEQEERE